ncbi:MAG: hypothetical protein JSU66_16765 [Deltaproteobacteria bacterium]|nr:MAG: hypothetical protein JSU66_16765 [Deltaproteobacteria bacterium]
MASRPLTFGIRYSEKGRTVRVRASKRDASRYVVEVSRRGEKSRRQEHGSLTEAVRDFAAAWRSRLH